MWHAQRLVSASSNARAAVVRQSKFLRCYSASSVVQDTITVWYASQGGTAQLFAHQLAEGVEDEMPETDVIVKGLHEQPSKSLRSASNEDTHLFLVSCAGVGEVPDNGRDFYDWIMGVTTTSTSNNSNDNNSNNSNNNPIDDWKQVNYAVFGLGNQKAHPNHYNVIGKKLDAQLQTLGANRFQPLGLGDDGDCIDDDFDQWMEETVERLKSGSTVALGKEVEDSLATTRDNNDSSPAEAEIHTPSDDNVNDDQPRISCPKVSNLPDGTRCISKKYPTLSLEPATNDIVRPDLFFLQGTTTHTSNAFYSKSTQMLPVLQNQRLALDAGEAGMHELQIALPPPSQNDDRLEYTSGDHILVYPRNSDAVVQAYVDLLEVDPHAIIVGEAKHKNEDDDNDDSSNHNNKKHYPYPTGITVMETLTHCVDLGAPPSPSFARILLGRNDLDYRQEIAIPRRTIMDVLLEQKRNHGNTKGKKLSLEDLLYQAAPMKPRYYSIASSNVQYPHQIHLTYRPIKYVTSHGYLREGVCTSFLSHKGVLPKDRTTTTSARDQDAASIPVSIVPNTTFRLPSLPETPVMMIGGGCGVAPIRAFLQERVHLSSAVADAASGHNNNGNSSNKFGPGILYMGYRNPQDAVYRELIQEALECGALTEAQVVYSSGCTLPTQKCMLVSELIRQEGATVWKHMENGGHVYICGGAYAFGATVKAELLDLVQEHGKMTFEESEAYLRRLMDNGRFSADLAD
ncbi:MAG: hypothetical protein SGBAC_005910 [Bacillariaceae sp.]